MQSNELLFMVEMGNIHVITIAYGREGAKNNAYQWMGGDPDKYIVTTLTDPGDRIHMSLTLRV